MGVEAGFPSKSSRCGCIRIHPVGSHASCFAFLHAPLASVGVDKTAVVWKGRGRVISPSDFYSLGLALPRLGIGRHVYISSLICDHTDETAVVSRGMGRAMFPSPPGPGSRRQATCCLRRCWLICMARLKRANRLVLAVTWRHGLEYGGSALPGPPGDFQWCVNELGGGHVVCLHLYFQLPQCSRSHAILPRSLVCTQHRPVLAVTWRPGLGYGDPSCLDVLGY